MESSLAKLNRPSQLTSLSPGWYQQMRQRTLLQLLDKANDRQVSHTLSRDCSCFIFILILWLWTPEMDPASRTQHHNERRNGYVLAHQANAFQTRTRDIPVSISCPIAVDDTFCSRLHRGHTLIPLMHRTVSGITSSSYPISTPLPTLVLAADRDLISNAAQNVVMTHSEHPPMNSQF